MNYEELEAAYRIAVAFEKAVGDDHSRAVEVFGEAGAAKYEKLRRKAESVYDREGADAASAEIMRMESGLTRLQEMRLFGIGEVRGVTPEEVGEYMKALGGLDYDTPTALGRSIARPLLDLGDETDPAFMSPGRQLAFAQVRAALEYALGRGWSYRSVLIPAVAAARSRFTDGADGVYMTAPVIAALAAAGETWAVC